MSRAAAAPPSGGGESSFRRLLTALCGACAAGAAAGPHEVEALTRALQQHEGTFLTLLNFEVGGARAAAPSCHRRRLALALAKPPVGAVGLAHAACAGGR